MSKRVQTFRATVSGLVLILLASGSSSAADPVQLRWGFKPGDVHHYRLSQTSVTRGTDADGKTFETSLGLTLDLRWTIEAVSADGSAKIAQRVERFRTEFKSPLGTMAYDSRTDSGKLRSSPNSPTAMLFQALVGAEFTFKLAATGGVSDVAMSSKLRQTVANLSAEGNPSKGLFTEEGLKNMVARLGTELPNQPVAPGGQWSRTVLMPGAQGTAALTGPARLASYDYTYKGTEPAAPGAGSPLDRVEIAARIDPPPTDPERPVVLQYQNLSAKGHYLFDRTIGALHESKVVEHMEMVAKTRTKALKQSVETTTRLTREREAATARR